MKYDDDNLRLAAALEQEPDAREAFRNAIKSIGIAPLAALIEQYLAHNATTQIAPTLKKIADKNQGSLADLDSPDFRSYLISRLKIDEKAIRMCRDALITYNKVISAQTSAITELAARGGLDSTDRTTDASDILDNLRRRK